MIKITIQDFFQDILALSDQIKKHHDGDIPYGGIYGVPRGGIHVAAELSHLLGVPLVDRESLSSDWSILVVDDLVDSGRTRQRYWDHDFACLHMKSHTPLDFYPTHFVRRIDDWIEYWWEVGSVASGIEDNVVRILQFIGEDPARVGLVDTPSRVAKMYRDFFCGYDPSRQPKITAFPNGEDGVAYNEMLRDEGYFTSYCEHHLVPFFGSYYYGYIPDKLLMGASKIGRTIDYYSGRLQIAERLVNQVVTAIDDAVHPLGQVLVMNARHLCKEMRGLKKWNSPFEAIAVRGYFAENRNGCKDEFMSRIQGR